MIRRWPEKILLLAASFFFATFFLFSLFEVFPEIPNRLPLQRIRYYALKERYLNDPELVFRRKPLYHYEGSFIGDHYGLFSDKNAGRIPYRARFDEDGFRNAPGAPAPEAALIGDSFIEFGTNEEDTLAGRLSQATGIRTGTYGMEWYGPFQYLGVFKRTLIPKKPRLVFFCFFEGNDLRDIHQFMNWQTGGSYYHFNLTSKNFFERYLITLKDVVSLTAKLFLRGFDPRRVQVKLRTKSFETVFSYPADLRPVEEITSSAEAQALDKIFAEFKIRADQNGIAPAVLFIPDKAHIYGDYVTRRSQTAWLADHRDEWLKNKNNLESAVQQSAAKAGLPWVSLTRPFEEAAAGDKIIFYPTDTHWNSEGRALAADFIRQSAVWQENAARSNPPASLPQSGG